jgi:hypothetical protein
MRVSDKDIQFIESVLTITAGQIVYAADSFSGLSPPLPPASPDWSPVDVYGGTYNPQRPAAKAEKSRPSQSCSTDCGHGCELHGHSHQIAWDIPLPIAEKRDFWGALGCSCFVF